jgi:tetratricopeptide (TPR) repeat protein
MKTQLFLAALSLALSATAFAADTEPAPRAGDPLAAARLRIQAKQWSEAAAELKKLNATRDADWNNLMGFALRKMSPPDLDGAQRHYDAALRIAPKHLGALEYAGELALMKGNLAQAEERLATLMQACRSCEELEDLKQAVAKFKANGNRYVP